MRRLLLLPPALALALVVLAALAVVCGGVGRGLRASCQTGVHGMASHGVAPHRRPGRSALEHARTCQCDRKPCVLGRWLVLPSPSRLVWSRDASSSGWYSEMRPWSLQYDELALQPYCRRMDQTLRP